MSLLLEALKKAELAKQAQQGHESSETTLPLSTTSGGGGAGVDLPTGEATFDQPLDLSTTKQGDPAGAPLMTRDRLPSLDQPIEFMPDSTLDIGGSKETTNPRPSGLDLRLDETLPPTPAHRLSATGAAAGVSAAATLAARASEGRTDLRNDARETTQPNKPWIAPAEDRDAARQVFQAKNLDYNPRRPFFMVLGALGCVVLGTIGYFWWQMQPAGNFRASPKPASAVAAAPSASGPVTPAPISPIAAAPASAAPVAAPPMVVVPDLTGPAPAKPTPAPPKAAAVEPPRNTPTPTPAERGVITTFERVPVPPQPAAFPRPTAAVGPVIRREPLNAEGSARIVNAAPANTTPVTVQRTARQLDPAVERGYASFQEGDLEKARQHYLGALRSDSLNRDALLGLAAIDVRTQSFESAESRYQRVLEIDPRDTHAQAGLIGLRGFSDPVQSESRTKSLLSQQPEAAPLHFTLGNQYAAQGRWGEAQASYFKAYTSDPENADYAYNLAVSLDQIRQRKPALEYYQRALDLARDRQAMFDRNQVSARVAELQK